MDTEETQLVPLDKPVLILNLAKYYGGASVRTLQIARMLQEVDYPFCVVTLKNSPLYESLSREGLTVVSLPYGRGDLRIAFWLRKFMRDKGYQVIDTHNPQSHLWGLLAAKLLKHTHVITTVHGCYGEAEQGWRSCLYNAVLRWNDQKTADFISVSESVTRYLHKIGIKQATITYSTNAILPSVPTEQAINLRDLAGWSADVVIISIAARLEPVKGIDYLIKAFAEAQCSCNQLRLCIMGEGRLRDELEALVESLGLLDVVYFAGFRQDVGELLKTSDIFCLASLSEGLPFAVLEAAMAKLPLVLSEVGGMAEFFVHQQTALLFPAKNTEQMSQHFIFLASHIESRRELGERAYLVVAEKFSAQRMLEQTLTLYRRIML